MKKQWEKIISMLLVLAMVLTLGAISKVSVQAKGTVNSKTLCADALKATGNGNKLKYKSQSALDFGALSASAREKVINIQYVCDAKEVYSLCVMETKKKADAKSLLNDIKKYKKNNCNSDYLSDYTTTERQVFKNAICGKKGKYVWYIAMSEKKADNMKGQTAIKKKL